MQQVQRLLGVMRPLFSFDDWLGQASTYAILVAVLVIGCLSAGMLRQAFAFLLVGFPISLQALVKQLVQETPPSAYFLRLAPNQMQHGSYSFPSGHVVALCSLACLVWLMAPQLVRSGWLVSALRTGTLLVALTTGLARVYFGYHWPSDVLAGYLMAIVYVLSVHEWLLCEPIRQ